MPEPLKQNKNLLNQLCKSLLKSEKVEVDEYYLYSLQLAEWGLENGEAEGPWKVHQALLLSQVQMLYDVEIDLSKAQKFVLSDPTRASGIVTMCFPMSFHGSVHVPVVAMFAPDEPASSAIVTDGFIRR